MDGDVVDPFNLDRGHSPKIVSFISEQFSLESSKINFEFITEGTPSD